MNLLIPGQAWYNFRFFWLVHFSAAQKNEKCELLRLFRACWKT